MDDKSITDLEEEIESEETTREQFVENKYLNRLLHVKYSLAVLCLFGVTSALLIQITTRAANVSISGLQALAQLLAVWMSFLVIANLEFEDKHIRVNYFVNRLPKRARETIEIVILVLSIFWSVVIFAAALFGAISAAGTTIPTLGVPTSMLHAAPLLGMFLLTLAYLSRLKEAIATIRSTGGDSRA